MFKLIRESLDDILWPAVIVMFFWVTFFVNLTYGYNWHDLGIRPRSLVGLRGVVFSPFLHGDFGHLFSNSIPFLVSGGFIFHFWKKISWQLLGLMWFFSGFPVWLYAKPYTTHIGASGVVYAMIFFVFVSGLIRKNRNLSAIAMLLIFLYGGLIWGLFPQITKSGTLISWEGHMAGAITGLILAFVFREKGPEDDKDFEDDDEPPPQWWLESDETLREQNTTIRYHFRPGPEETTDD